MFVLKDRAVISVSGKGSKKFLQGLLTNDVFKVSPEIALFFLMLSPRGRVLYDFFIIEKDEDVLLVECSSDLLNEIIHRLSMYKLNHEVTLCETKYKVCVDFTSSLAKKKNNGDEIVFVDPRSAKMGKRSFTLGDFDESAGIEVYERARVENCIADVSKDLIKDVSFPLEYRMDYAFSFNKGCYIGQEVVARFRLKGETSRKLYVMKFLAPELQKQSLQYSFQSDAQDILQEHYGRQISISGENVGEIKTRVGDLALVHCNVKSLRESIDDVNKILVTDEYIVQVLNYS